MFVIYYQSTDGGLVMREANVNMTDQEWFEYANSIHYDIDIPTPVKQGPKNLDDWSDLYWYRWDLLEVCDVLVDDIGLPIQEPKEATSWEGISIDEPIPDMFI